MTKSQISTPALVAIAAMLMAGAWWLYSGSATQAAFVCPEPHAKATAGALKETPDDIASASAAFSGPERENAIRVIAANLKKTNPDAGNAEIVNYMLAAYCPLVARKSGLSNDDKRRQMERFGEQVRQIIQ